MECTYDEQSCLDALTSSLNNMKELPNLGETVKELNDLETVLSCSDVNIKENSYSMVMNHMIVQTQTLINKLKCLIKTLNSNQKQFYERKMENTSLFLDQVSFITSQRNQIKMSLTDIDKYLRIYAIDKFVKEINTSENLCESEICRLVNILWFKISILVESDTSDSILYSELSARLFFEITELQKYYNWLPELVVFELLTNLTIDNRELFFKIRSLHLLIESKISSQIIFKAICLKFIGKIIELDADYGEFNYKLKENLYSFNIYNQNFKYVSRCNLIHLPFLHIFGGELFSKISKYRKKNEHLLIEFEISVQLRIVLSILLYRKITLIVNKSYENTSLNELGDLITAMDSPIVCYGCCFSRYLYVITKH